jgi:hypothetical protein
MLLRALRWRAAASVATVLLSALTVLGVVLGPLWTHAGSESVLRDGLSTAPRDQNSATVSAHGQPGQALLDAVPTVSMRHYGRPVHGMTLQALLRLPGAYEHYSTPLYWRDDVCRHVQILTGRCPTKAGEVLVHRFLATALPARPGTALSADVQGELSNAPALPASVTVVGSYVQRDPTSDYWVGESAYFVSYAGEDEGQPDRMPATLTLPSTFDAISGEHASGEHVIGFATATRLLQVGGVRLRDTADLRADLNATRAQLNGLTSNAVAFDLADNTQEQLDAAQVEGKALGEASRLVLAQLVALTAVVLVLVIGASAASRAPEVAAARLRGLRLRTVLSLALTEPLTLVLVGAPLGALGAEITVRAMASYRLVPDTPVAITRGAVLALLGAVLALVVAVLAVCLRELGRPVMELWQRTTKPPSSRAVVGSVAVVLGCVAAAVWCVRRREPWVLLTPVPVSLACAVVTVRALPLLCLPALRRTRASRSVPRLLAVRQLVRRREGGWLVGLLVVAFGLAATAVTSWSVAGRAGAVRAASEVGAEVVLRVQADATHPDVDLRTAVRAADPSGTVAMAVVEYLPYTDEPGGRLLAVDSPRLAAVARWDENAIGAPVSAVAAGIVGRTGKVANAFYTRGVARDPLAVYDPTSPVGGAIVTGIDGHRLPVHRAGVLATLPRALDVGTLVDYGAFPKVGNAQVAGLQEVWLSRHDAAVEKALIAQGLEVLTTDTITTHRTLLGRQGPSLAVLLSLVAAGLALAVATATTLFSVLTSARRRGYELASLAAVGVPAGMLRRAGRGEALLLLAVGLSAGVGAAAAACAVTLPYLPLFSDDLPLRVPLTPRVTPVVVLILVAAGLAIATAATVGRVLMRAADPSRLREVQA